jgi:hypothetical protein
VCKFASPRLRNRGGRRSAPLAAENPVAMSDRKPARAVRDRLSLT